MAAFTRSRVLSATRWGLFSTLETVPTDTPAAVATSLMLTDAVRGRSFDGSPTVVTTILDAVGAVFHHGRHVL